MSVSEQEWGHNVQRVSKAAILDQYSSYTALTLSVLILILLVVVVVMVAVAALVVVAVAVAVVEVVAVAIPLRKVLLSAVVQTWVDFAKMLKGILQHHQFRIRI